MCVWGGEGWGWGGKREGGEGRGASTGGKEGGGGGVGRVRQKQGRWRRAVTATTYASQEQASDSQAVRASLLSNLHAAVVHVFSSTLPPPHPPHTHKPLV